MLSNQVLHRTLVDISEITGAELSIWNMDGICILETGNASGLLVDGVKAFIRELPDKRVKTEEGVGLFSVCYEQTPVYVLAMYSYKEGGMEIAGRLCVSELEALLLAYHEHPDKNHFIQNLILDNLLVVDIYNQARKLHIETDVPRVVFSIEPKYEEDNIVLETLKGLYAMSGRDFITSIDENHIVLVKTLDEKNQAGVIEKTAKTIVDTLSAEAMIKVRVAYGSVVRDLKQVSKSYKEAAMALDVGRIFYSEKNIIAYGELGIGRLIYQLPVSLCEMFLGEVFEGKKAEEFEEETLYAVNKFFQNNLNISETARQLYVHRNTLVYRLEKIQKTIGLDVRVFDDALTFKIAMMVAEHLKYLKKD